MLVARNSGMMVQDPTRGHRDVDAMFDRVRQFGAREGTAEPPQPAAPSNRGVFAGTARTLTGEPRQQELPPATPTAGPAPRAAPEPVFHTITFWRNGFTVDDGSLRRMDDPANEPFLEVLLSLFQLLSPFNVDEVLVSRLTDAAWSFCHPCSSPLGNSLSTISAGFCSK